MTEVFLDTAYAIALSSSSDQFHKKAVELAEQLEQDGARLITTHAVLLEVGNALSKMRYRTAAVALLEALEADPNVEIVPISEDLLRRFDVSGPRYTSYPTADRFVEARRVAARRRLKTARPPAFVRRRSTSLFLRAR